MKSFLSVFAPETNSVINDLARLCSADSGPICVHQCTSVVDSPPSFSPLPSVKFVPLKFKYVIIRAQDVETAIIVPGFAQHNWAINLQARNPISAGFAWRDQSGSVHVEGESTSLNLKSRPQDAEIIRETLFMNGL
jgi:hypothetical protein